MHHRVYPVIYQKLKQVDEERIPSHVVQTLNRKYKNNTFQMLYLSAEMERINKLFNENEIRTMFLKGPCTISGLIWRYFFANILRFGRSHSYSKFRKSRKTTFRARICER